MKRFTTDFYSVMDSSHWKLIVNFRRGNPQPETTFHKDVNDVKSYLANLRFKGRDPVVCGLYEVVAHSEKDIECLSPVSTASIVSGLVAEAAVRHAGSAAKVGYAATKDIGLRKKTKKV